VTYVEAAAAVATIVRRHPVIRRVFDELPPSVNEPYAALVLPGTIRPVDSSLDGEDWTYEYELRIWLLFGPMVTTSINRLMEAASAAPEIGRLIVRAFLDGDPGLDGFELSQLPAFNARITPVVGDTAFWGGELTVWLRKEEFDGLDEGG
jgi:hypothetical protein